MNHGNRIVPVLAFAAVAALAASPALATLQPRTVFVEEMGFFT